MKYWLFDGNDVVGPFTLGELAARPDFSAASLICAEDASEDAAGWQMASFFETFRFNPITGRVDGVFPTEKQAQVAPVVAARPVVQAEEIDLPPAQVRSVAPAQQPVAQPTQQPPADLITESNTNWVPPEKVEKTIPPAKQTAAAAQPETQLPPQPAPVQKTPAQTVPATPEKQVSKPHKKEDFSFVRLSRSKRLQAPPSPVALAQENVDLILPQQPQPVTPEEKPAVEEPPAETVSAPAPASKPAEKQPVTKPEPEKLPDPETEIISTCTLPIVNEILTQSDLPKLPEGNFPSVALPAEPQFAWKEILAEEQTSPAPNEDDVADAQPVDNPVAAEQVSVPEPEEFYTTPQRPSTQTVNEAEQELVPQNPVEDLMEEQFLEKPTRKKAHLALYILLVLMVGCAGWFFGVPHLRALALARAPRPQTPPVVETAQKIAPEEKKEEVPLVAPQPVSAPKPVTAADKALAAVQNYQLANNKGTVASYFDRIYASHLQQGYTANWSVEPLHKNIYIVKYRLTKTRTEPIMYVFQADGARGQLTGALNNVALDLIGRI